MLIFDISFWQSFLSNLLATLLGVAIGIPIALWLSKIQEIRIETDKKRKILAALQEELHGNLMEITIRENDLEIIKLEAGVLKAMLKDNLWRTFSDGGELQWIKDLDILGKLSNAYYFTDATMYLSDKYYDSVQFAKADSSRLRIGAILLKLQEAMIYARQEITGALEMIEREIQSKKPK